MRELLTICLLITSPHLNCSATDSSAISKEKAFQSEIRNCLKKHGFAKSILATDAHQIGAMMQFYAALQSSQNASLRINQTYRKTLTYSILLILRSGYKYAHFKKTGRERCSKVALLRLLQFLSYKQGLPLQIIEKWWREEGSKQTPDKWLDCALERIARKKGPISPQDSMSIYWYILDQHYEFKSYTDFAMWWQINKNKSPDEWMKNSLRWAIDNLDSPSPRISFVSQKTIYTLLDTSTLNFLGLTKNGSVNYAPKNSRQKEKLLSWFQKNAAKILLPMPFSPTDMQSGRVIPYPDLMLMSFKYELMYLTKENNSVGCSETASSN